MDARMPRNSDRRDAHDRLLRLSPLRVATGSCESCLHRRREIPAAGPTSPAAQYHQAQPVRSQARNVRSLAR